MKTVRDLLQDADPLRHEPYRIEEERERLRRAVLMAADNSATPSAANFYRPVAILVILGLSVLGVVTVVSQIWSQGGATLQAAAIGFELRLAEHHDAAGLREARIAGTDRVVYLHPQIIVTNGDIEQSRVVLGDRPSRFGVGVQFNAAGTEKMRKATATHVGRPVAILLDGDVAAAPVVKSTIGPSATISGDYTKSEAERIANGIGVR